MSIVCKTGARLYWYISDLELRSLLKSQSLMNCAGNVISCLESRASSLESQELMLRRGCASVFARCGYVAVLSFSVNSSGSCGTQSDLTAFSIGEVWLCSVIVEDSKGLAVELGDG